MTRMSRLAVAALTAMTVVAGPAAAEDVTVFAAASLKTALDRIVKEWEGSSGNSAVVSYAGSSQLARQIQEGAPADIFISAATDWMDTLEQAAEIDPASRVDLLGNTLVLVRAGGEAAADAPDIDKNYDLKGQLAGGKLAMALVESVPAGVYGKQALTSLGLWDSVSQDVAQADNVRAALALVATREAPMGIVYATDAHAEPAVSIAGVFPADSHDPITYPAALVKGAADRPAAVDLFETMKGTAARAVFEGEGFTLPPAQN